MAIGVGSAFAQVVEPSSGSLPPTVRTSVVGVPGGALPSDIDSNAPGLGGGGIGPSYITDALEHTYLVGPQRVFETHVPSDSHATVGPNHLAAVVNCTLQIFDFETGALVVSRRLGHLPGTPDTTVTQTDATGFFEPAPASALNTLFDPRIIYDQHDNRFVLVALEHRTLAADGVDSSRILIAVSETMNPTGNWIFRAINSAPTINGNVTWADFPRIAVDGDALYITANMFSVDPANQVFAGSRLWILDKAQLYAGQTQATAMTVGGPFDPHGATGQALALDSAGYAPAQVYGANGVLSGIGTYLVGWQEVTGNESCRIIRINTPLGTPTFTALTLGLGNIHDEGGFPGRNPAAQQVGDSDAGHRLDTGSRRIQNAVWRGERLYFCNTVVPPAVTLPAIQPDAGQATVRWYSVNTTSFPAATLADSGYVGAETLGAGTSTFYPCIAVDSQNNLGLAFNYAGPTTNGGVGYTGRKFDAPAGTMQPVAIGAAGVDGYYRPRGGRNRWGDYTAIALDPDDQSTFWGIGQFAESQGNPDTDVNGTPIAANNGQWGTGLLSFSERSYYVRNDYNADGFPDLVTRNTTSGGIAIYEMNGSRRVSTAVTVPRTLGFPILATGDINADLKTDFIYKNASGYIRTQVMNGVSRITDRPFSYQGNTTLTYPGPVVATGDFDRDGITDLVLQNSTTGAVRIWYLGNNANLGLNTDVKAVADLSPQLTNYLTQQVRGAADFDGDGIPDLILQNLTTNTANQFRGNVTVYLLNQGTRTPATITLKASRPLNPQIISVNTVVSGTDDIDGDGLTDLLTQRGTIINWYQRTIPTGQTQQTTTTFNVNASLPFYQADGTTVLPLPANTTLRN